MDQKTPEPTRLPEVEAAKRRRGRSWAILIALFGLCALFYAITIVKMTHS
jgi:hypothetical protein